MFANDKHLPGGFRLLAHQKCPVLHALHHLAPRSCTRLSRVALPDAR